MVSNFGNYFNLAFKNTKSKQTRGFQIVSFFEMSIFCHLRFSLFDLQEIRPSNNNLLVFIYS